MFQLSPPSFCPPSKISRDKWVADVASGLSLCKPGKLPVDKKGGAGSGIPPSPLSRRIRMTVKMTRWDQDDRRRRRERDGIEVKGSKGGAWNSISTLPLSSPSMRIRMTRGIRTSVEIRMTEDQGWNQGHQECFPSLSPLLFTSERLCWWLSAVGKEKDEGVRWLGGSIWN